MSSLSAPFVNPMPLSEPAFEIMDSGEVVEVCNNVSTALDDHAVPVDYSQDVGEFSFIDGDGRLLPYFHETDSPYSLNWVQLKHVPGFGAERIRKIRRGVGTPVPEKDNRDLLPFLETFEADGGTQSDYGANKWTKTGLNKYWASISEGLANCGCYYQPGYESWSECKYQFNGTLTTAPVNSRTRMKVKFSGFGDKVDGDIGAYNTVGYGNSGSRVNGTWRGNITQGSELIVDVGHYDGKVYQRKDHGDWNIAAGSQGSNKPYMYAFGSYNAGDGYLHWMFLMKMVFPEPTVLIYQVR